MSPQDEHDWPLETGEPAPDQQEQELARQLGAATDSLLAGATLPVDAEDDELLAATRMIRGAGGAEEHLSSERKQQLVTLALEEAGAAVARPTYGGSLRRAAPYLALAASIVLLLSALMVGLPAMRDDAGIRTSPPRTQLLSRPSNDLMGRPFKDRAGAARRLDRVFADRLHGYRQVRLAVQTTTVMP